MGALKVRRLRYCPPSWGATLASPNRPRARARRMPVSRRPHSAQPPVQSSGICCPRPQIGPTLGHRAGGAGPAFPYKARPRREEPGSGRPRSCHEAGEGRAGAWGAVMAGAGG
ncbi:hypothetical protein P7K49_002781 [Saguinus oedipus]|uniref:Uncharacterized protein n=1 Tax=Saguinus oedipus TaxID=9490 RepID=A0ABQ9WIV3_SAGOE|nr:hypothetical protein P7K49_002781 [Saguinus oedipus]